MKATSPLNRWLLRYRFMSASKSLRLHPRFPFFFPWNMSPPCHRSPGWESFLGHCALRQSLWKQKEMLEPSSQKQASFCLHHPHHRRDFLLLLSPSCGTVQMPNASEDTLEVCPKPLSWTTWRFLCRQDRLPPDSSTKRWTLEIVWKPHSHVSSIQRLSWRAVEFPWRSCG